MKSHLIVLRFHLNLCMKKGKQFIGALNVKLFSQSLGLQMSVLVIHWHCFQISYAGSQVSFKEQPCHHDLSLNNLSVMYQSTLNIGSFS